MLGNDDISKQIMMLNMKMLACDPLKHKMNLHISEGGVN